jgi:hypothetical protein
MTMIQVTRTRERWTAIVYYLLQTQQSVPVALARAILRANELNETTINIPSYEAGFLIKAEKLVEATETGSKVFTFSQHELGYIVGACLVTSNLHLPAPTGVLEKARAGVRKDGLASDIALTQAEHVWLVGEMASMPVSVIRDMPEHSSVPGILTELRKYGDF